MKLMSFKVSVGLNFFPFTKRATVDPFKSKICFNSCYGFIYSVFSMIMRCTFWRPFYSTVKAPKIRAKRL